MSAGSTPPPLPWDQEEAQPASTGRRWLLILGLIIGIPVGCIALLGGLGWLYLATAKDVAILPKDEAVVVQVEDVRQYLGEKFTPLASAETIKKSRYFDGSHEIDYTYDHPRDGQQTLYLSNTVGIERDVSEAIGNYHGSRVAIRATMSVLGETKLTHTDRNDLFRWGDDSSLSIISSDGEPVGNLFCARKGNRVFTLLMVGLYFDDAEGIRNLLGPKLAQLEKYEP
jgi:hypothetical protein